MEEEKYWWKKETVAVVTGGNRGIGLEIVRQLACKGITVVLTCRKEQQGLAAAQALVEGGLHNVHFHILDVQRSDSVTDLAQWLHTKFGGLDILINNAAVMGQDMNWEIMREKGLDMRQLLFYGTSNETAVYDFESARTCIDINWWHSSMSKPIPICTRPSPFQGFKPVTEIKFYGTSNETALYDFERARTCIDINYYGTKRVVKGLLPLLLTKSFNGRPRIVNVSSLHGLLKLMPNPLLQKQLSDMDMDIVSEDFLDSMLMEFLEDVKENTKVEEKGWPAPFSAYKMSKTCINTYTRLLAHELRDQNKEVYVNCIHPGYVKTGMTFDTGDLSASEGAENVVQLTLFPPGGASGKFFIEKEISHF